MDGSGDPRIPQRHVAELSTFFAAHDRWLFGHACVRTRGDRELAADLVQDTFEAAARAWATLRGHADGRQRAWLLGTLANKDISDFRRKEALRRRQSDIQARYQPAAADTAAQALSAIALERAREIIEKISVSAVPVIVYVTPTGGHAGSAGIFILESADVAAMAPGTAAGAAHPVTIIGPVQVKPDDEMNRKIENDAASPSILVTEAGGYKLVARFNQFERI